MLLQATLLSLALPVYGAVHESLPGLPYGWSESSSVVDDETRISMSVSLQLSNADQLESMLQAVSDPCGAQYGQYIDIVEANAIFGASNSSVSAVTSWLDQSGAFDIASDGMAVSFTISVGNANSMLDTTFKIYTDGFTQKLRTTAYSIPNDLIGHIDLVSPTTYFGNTKAHKAIPSQTSSNPSKRQLQPSCETVITIPISANRTKNYTVVGPECLKELYNIGDYSVDVTAGSTIAFGSFLGQSASYSDLAMFEDIWGIPRQNFTVLALINGGVDNQDPMTEENGEANLDVQNIVGLVDGLPVGEYITGGSPPFVPDLLAPNASLNQNEPYLEYYQYLLSQPNSNLPYVISNSYGDHENTVPEAYAKRVCNMIGILGLRGRTILESSGDEGVGAVCLNNEPPNQPQFTPQFPGTCPYITSVGGTQLVNPENAWNASSGGFSYYFPTAWYQQDAVNTYLSQYISSETKEYYSSNNYTNFAGRGFPDISAHSLWPDYLTVINGTAEPNGGTSAAAPVVAAILALINDARLRAGQPAIGFANPWLYKIAGQALNDITLGQSLGCAGVDLQSGEEVLGAGIIPYASWNATVGWDPVTGLGTPDFKKMKDWDLQWLEVMGLMRFYCRRGDLVTENGYEESRGRLLRLAND